MEENVEIGSEKGARGHVKRFGSEVVINRNRKKGVVRDPLGYPKRGRGRPPKDGNVGGVVNGEVNVVSVAGVKKTGRPKSLVAWKQEVTKKVESRVLRPANPQWMVDYAHVRAKIDHIQSRMRDAIGVIKPHSMNQNTTNGNISAALQELDQISTMDVMAVSLGGTVEQPERPSGTRVY